MLHLISKLCRIKIEYVREKAIALNRNQIVLYSRGQNIFVTCQNGNAGTLNYHRKVTGLTVISLPSYRDCTLTTSESQFRASPYSEPMTFETHNIGVKFSTAELLNLTQQELTDATNHIDQFHLKDVSLDEAKLAFKRIQFNDEISHRQSYLFVGLMCLGAVMILNIGRVPQPRVEIPLNRVESNANYHNWVFNVSGIQLMQNSNAANLYKIFQIFRDLFLNLKLTHDDF